MLLRVHPVTPQTRLVDQAADILRRDGVLAWPTCSGYGVGTIVSSPRALRRLYQMTNPDKTRLLSLMFRDFGQISQWAQVDNASFRLMRHVMPGPYTFILPARTRVIRTLEVKRSEVGVRMPVHPFLDALMDRIDAPLVNMAARFSDREGELFTEGEPIERQYGRLVDAVVDVGFVPVNPTTVVRLTDGQPVLVRVGQGSLEPLGL